VLGAIANATSELHVTTVVVCPTVCIHPVIIAHAAATTAQLFDGRFALGLGSGEALNEHILGERWPSIEVRLDMLEEAIDHHGPHYTVENARLWTLSEAPPKLLMSAFGPKAVALAARTCEDYVDAWPTKRLLGSTATWAGAGPALGELKVCRARRICPPPPPTSPRSPVWSPRTWWPGGWPAGRAGAAHRGHPGVRRRRLRRGPHRAGRARPGGMMRFYEREILPHVRRPASDGRRAVSPCR
jgi:hypothetical protein